MEERLIESPLLKVAEVELVYKTKVKASDRFKITGTKDTYRLFLDSWDENKLEFVEQFKVMLLNRAFKVLGISTISTGGISGTVVDPKLIFATALKAKASYFVVAHNHPSGRLKPSRADEELTAKINQAGNFLDLPLLDHLIITTEGYLSFKEEGLL